MAVKELGLVEGPRGGDIGEKILERMASGCYTRGLVLRCSLGELIFSMALF